MYLQLIYEIYVFVDVKIYVYVDIKSSFSGAACTAPKI